MPFSPSFRPWFRNCSPKVVFPVPKEPITTTVCDFGKPPSSISSKPSIPLLTLSTIGSPYPFRVYDNETALCRDHRREACDALLVEVRQDAHELLDVQVPLPPRGHGELRPLEDQ